MKAKRIKIVIIMLTVCLLLTACGTSVNTVSRQKQFLNAARKPVVSANAFNSAKTFTEKAKETFVVEAEEDAVFEKTYAETTSHSPNIKAEKEAKETSEPNPNSKKTDAEKNVLRSSSAIHKDECDHEWDPIYFPSYKDNVPTMIHHEAVTEEVWHEPEYETVHHDAVTEWVPPVYKNVFVCKWCGYETENITSHVCVQQPVMRPFDGNNESRSHFVKNVLVEEGYYKTVSEAYDEVVLVREGYTETVVVKEAWDEIVYTENEPVLMGYICRKCGAVNHMVYLTDPVPNNRLH